MPVGHAAGALREQRRVEREPGLGHMMVQARSDLAPAIVMPGMPAVGIVGAAPGVALRPAEALVKSRRGQA